VAIFGDQSLAGALDQHFLHVIHRFDQLPVFALL
jgi:hypothetical protein